MMPDEGSLLLLGFSVVELMGSYSGLKQRFEEELDAIWTY